MTAVRRVVSEIAIWVDAQGNVVDDPAFASSGEITTRYDDGTVEHNLVVRTDTLGDRPPADGLR